MTTTILITLFFLIVGIILIVRGGDAFVDAASWIAEISGIPQFIIGATIVSLATTLPELIVSALAAMDGKADMAAGNAIGSVSANIGFIMAISMVCMPGFIKRSQIAFKSLLMVTAAALLIFLSWDGFLSTSGSLYLLIVFLFFIVENIRGAKKGTLCQQQQRIKILRAPGELGHNILKFILGATGIVIGADLMVDNGSQLAMLLGVSERIIAVTIIAIGTSLPELVTTLTAIAKHQPALSIGNIIGANILDLTMILPICSIISGGKIMISHHMGVLDMPVCLGIILLAVIPSLLHQRFSRKQGIVLLTCYILYIIALCIP